jgi:arylformamidase
MKEGAPFNLSKITAGSHMGTHADASCHFLKDSDVGIDKMELFRYYGPCRVVTVPESALITKKDLEGKIDNCERLVLRGGGNSYLARDAAEYIVEKGINTVVTDALSIAPIGNETEIHVIILTPGTAVVESVVLNHVADGEYTLCAFPIKIEGCDGAPVRAVLISE